MDTQVASSSASSEFRRSNAAANAAARSSRVCGFGLVSTSRDADGASSAVAGAAGVVAAAGAALRLAVSANRRLASRAALDTIATTPSTNELAVELELSLLLSRETTGNICPFTATYPGCRLANRSAPFSSCASVPSLAVAQTIPFAAHALPTYKHAGTSSGLHPPRNTKITAVTYGARFAGIATPNGVAKSVFAGARAISRVNNTKQLVNTPVPPKKLTSNTAGTNAPTIVAKHVVVAFARTDAATASLSVLNVPRERSQGATTRNAAHATSSVENAPSMYSNDANTRWNCARRKMSPGQNATKSSKLNNGFKTKPMTSA
mmetsp:Transcript_2850/g.10956  ORF Transcript_2850/g.10956 Transcript_2850/m.10956 type:complete len:321 (-) Transcript_2850:86-1048(-)